LILWSDGLIGFFQEDEFVVFRARNHGESLKINLTVASMAMGEPLSKASDGD
jgi:hypothetical protein